MKLINNWKAVGLLCLTLGLAPFKPEPHLLGKIKWIAGGANGMTVIDWWDVILHGTPFILLCRILIINLRTKFKKA
ncbi:MAG: hypothetical protein ACJAZ2_002429 [Glaciecola sp.]|jgi:hypothetical protein